MQNRYCSVQFDCSHFNGLKKAHFISQWKQEDILSKQLQQPNTKKYKKTTQINPIKMIIVHI